QWDGWPDGDYSHLFSLEEAEACDNLRVHWACEPLGGSGAGSPEAEIWHDGKITRRKCQGVIECTSRACNILIRPQTRAAGIRKQLEVSCSCGGTLAHIPCHVVSVLHTFKHGVHYQNGGLHSHPRPTARLHMSRKETADLRQIVQANPTAGPLKLLVGRPGIDGPGKSVAEITPVLYNSERIRYERRKILKGSGLGRNNGVNFSRQFAKFQEEHPGFIREAQFGKIGIIVMQTPFMAASLVKATIGDEAINGIVSDAAHGVWKVKNDLLVVSSTFEPEALKCWVPGLMSWTNGGTAEHYRIHFYHLFRGIGEECAERNLEVSDDLFANVLDFSTAERNGFILAFVDFWHEHAPNERTIDELLDAAPKLLKGCAQHFRDQINRVKKISAIVDPAKIDIFENYAKKLLKCHSMDEFNLHANKFIKAFPRAESWIRWWMLPAHASMLFPSFRIMTLELWNSLPATTNAEEAMHWKIYAALGKFLALLEGLKGLYKFAEYYSQLSEAQKHGVKIFYGPDRQPWKRSAASFGYTKFSRRQTTLRAAKHANDGRPPDTGKALLGRKPKKHTPEYEKSYPWKQNSCWLDCSLTLICAAASRDFDRGMDAMFSDLPADHPLQNLRQMVYTRLMSVDLSLYQDGGCTLLGKQRDGFRKLLCNVPNTPVESTTGFNTIFGWMYHISGQRVPHVPEASPSVDRAKSYFSMWTVAFKTCTGSSHDHYQVSPVRLRNIYQVHQELCRTYGGDLRRWFHDFIRVSKAQSLAGCWHARDGARFCDGSATEFNIILNIPIVFTIEIADSSSSTWNIPSSLSPYASNPAASNAGVKYTVVGHVYCNKAVKHFIARYLSTTGKKVFDYDGMKYEGHAVRNRATAMRGSLTGSSRAMLGVPSGYQLYAVMFHLVGGEQAQQTFRRQQIADAQKLGLRF
ncbi:hypothetical protein B0H15DRAFT_1001560, partial [Mycena belliarum]